MKKKSICVVTLLVLLFFTIFLVFLLKDEHDYTDDDVADKNITNTDVLKFKEEYETVNNNENSVQINISEDSPIKYLSYEELISKINKKENFVLYLGFPTCPWCRNIIPVLFDTANANNNKVYYINTRELKSLSVDNYNALYNLVYDYLEEDKVLYVPDVYFFKNGEIIGHHLGSVDSQTNPYVTLNEEQKNELKNIYQNLFNEIKGLSRN